VHESDVVKLSARIAPFRNETFPYFGPLGFSNFRANFGSADLNIIENSPQFRHRCAKLQRFLSAKHMCLRCCQNEMSERTVLQKVYSSARFLAVIKLKEG
jgi:hypothetical protein